MVEVDKCVYRRAVEYFGEDAQLSQAKEELAELIVAISHYQRGKCDKDAVLSEMADVQIMLNQLGIIIGGNLTHFIYKIDRLKQIIGIEDEDEKEAQEETK